MSKSLKYFMAVAFVFLMSAAISAPTMAFWARGFGPSFARSLSVRSASNATAANVNVLPKVMEVWFGSIKTPAASVCTDDDYLETALIYTRALDTSTITYNGSNCAAAAGSPNTNHFRLGAGTYRITLSTHQTNNATSDTCTINVYGDTGGSTLIVAAKSNGSSPGTQGAVVFLTAAGDYVFYPWSNACTGDNADIQSNIMIERLLVN